jgi:GNAT superfamily N-acetyltransferase
LLQAAIEEARRQQIDHLEWQTPAWNEDAIRFYRRQGASHANKVRFRLTLRNQP